ncbi:MAG: helix-turn-helix domain-containing protein [Patescibacteria group bacterium]|jgi:sugar-specific transcriptional regulator TrmB
MNESVLINLGLSPLQAKVYVVLVINSPATPPQLAKLVGATRTNTYKVLEQLQEIGLIRRDETQLKLRFWASSPKALQELAESNQQQAKEELKLVEASMPKLMDEYFKHSLHPDVRFMQGQEGIVAVFNDYVKTGQELYLIRSWKDRDFLGKGVLSIWRKQPSANGITTNILAPDTASASSASMDELYLFNKTWMQEEDYTAPVEWCAYGDKLAIISYGNEAVSMIIQSKQIADAFKQLFSLLSIRQKEWKYYTDFPKKARLSDDPAVIETQAYKDVVKKRQNYIKMHGKD